MMVYCVKNTPLSAPGSGVNPEKSIMVQGSVATRPPITSSDPERGTDKPKEGSSIEETTDYRVHRTIPVPTASVLC